MPTDDVLVVGRIGAPYGIQGWVHLHSFTSPQENILTYKPWLLQRAKQAAWQPVTDVKCRRHKKGFVAAIDGVTDREAAAALVGSLVGVPATALPPVAQADEYYWRDLTGSRVATADGRYLGTVDHLIETGANDVLVVLAEPDEPGGPQTELLIPFAGEFVQSVDIENRSITVNWDPEW